MRRRRSRFFRDDFLAPWLTLGVILGVWWLGAHALSRDTGVASLSLPPWVEATVSVGKDAAPANQQDAIVAAPADGAESAPSDATETPVMVAVGGDVGELLAKRLLIPVGGVEAKDLSSTFEQARGVGRLHHAMDILAPRGTAVVAAIGGRIAKLFTSAAGGLTIYQFDPEEAFCYYYAHLDSYASNLTEGQPVTRGQVIGYVGTTGNAPPGTPHLHFAIFKLNAEKQWWDGVPLDPFLVLR